MRCGEKSVMLHSSEARVEGLQSRATVRSENNAVISAFDLVKKSTMTVTNSVCEVAIFHLEPCNGPVPGLGRKNTICTVKWSK